MSRERLVKADNRNRVSLARIGVERGYYMATLEPDGVILLRPVILVPARDVSPASEVNEPTTTE